MKKVPVRVCVWVCLSGTTMKRANFSVDEYEMFILSSSSYSSSSLYHLNILYILPTDSHHICTTYMSVWLLQLHSFSFSTFALFISLSVYIQKRNVVKSRISALTVQRSVYSQFFHQSTEQEKTNKHTWSAHHQHTISWGKKRKRWESVRVEMIDMLLTMFTVLFWTWQP